MYKQPNIYDSFYHNYFILNKMLEKEDFDKFLRTCKISNSKFNVLYGYVYFLSILAANIIDNLEQITRVAESNEIINWGRKTLADDAIHKLSKYDLNVKYVYKLKDKISKSMEILYAKNISEKDVLKLIIGLKRLLKNIKKQIDKEYKPIKILNDDITFRHSILNWLINYYGYHESPYRPGTLFYSLMTDESIKSFWLGHENKILFKRKDEIIFGYKCGIMYLCSYLSPAEFDGLKEKFDEALDLLALKDVCMKLGEITNCKTVNIFKIRRIPIQKAVHINVAKTNADLEILFRNRPIHLIRTTEFNGYKAFEIYEATLMLKQLILGYICEYYLKGQKMEIIRFEHEDPKYRKDHAYSYALYMPIFGSLGSNGSYWLLFDSVSLFNKSGYQSDTKILLDSLIEKYKESILLTTVKTSYNLLKAYTTRHGDTSLIKRLKERLGLSLGLSAEFLAYLYLQSRYKARLLALDRTFYKTDIDVLAENETTIFLAQVKTTVPLKEANLKKDVEQILLYFKNLDYDKLRNDYNIPKDKELKKYLFIMGFSYNLDFTEATEEDDEELDDSIIVLKRKSYLNKVLSKEGIEVAFFDELSNIYDSIGGENLQKKIKGVFNIEYNTFIFK